MIDQVSINARENATIKSKKYKILLNSPLIYRVKRIFSQIKWISCYKTTG